ncbi:amidohydrolase [Salimicrobium flavidum]|uniref:Amidohydrolase 3 domain-containing protein n=1 Tax=Salimicrobium flavidum TaxID=570947 RepID=A0A1N7IYY6_9BACI|nr:amidohydrolase [Salimicrobium flavidum]SIS42264.1 hypothetical protein SAMN05421687_1037 [Salimicrobium flavidum]
MEKMDVLITNAEVVTLDDNDSVAGSVAVKDGEIAWISTEKYPVDAPESGEVVDLEGRTLIPGFIDTHNHLLMYSQYLGQINCRSPLNENIGDIQKLIEAEAKQKEKGEWIIGWGYDDTLLEESRHPTREDLDAVAPDHPVLIRHISAHFAAVNSLALELAGVYETIEDPPGGHFGRDEQGALDGVLHEFSAMDFVDSIIPEYTEEDLAQLMEKGAREYVSKGITTSTDAGVGLVRGMEEYKAHVKVLKENRIPLRMRYMVLHHLLREGAPFAGYTREELQQQISEDTDDRATLDSAKMFQDGSIQGLTGALRHPYHCDSSITGNLIQEQKDFNEEVLDLHSRGFRMATHGNGDRAIGSIIDAYTYALEKNPEKDRRHRIEHVQTGSAEDLDRMKDWGIEASFFINHVYYWGDRHRDIFLGNERAARLNPLKDAAEKGFRFTLHSDCPITPISPLFSIWAAVNRITSGGEVLGEGQKIDALTALKSMTSYGAWLNFEEGITGTIEAGKRADFAVLDTNPLRCDPMAIKDISVEATYIGGEKVYGT